MAVDLAYMQGHFPALDLTNTDFVNKMIAWANGEVSQTLFGDRRDQAVSNLAAHFISQNTSSGGGGATGPVVSEKVGDQQITFKAPDSKDGSINNTPYGQEYLRIIGTVPTSPIVV